MARQVLSDLATASDTIRRETARRNQLVVQAREQGASWKEIMAATGLSRQGLNKLATAENGTLPIPVG